MHVNDFPVAPLICNFDHYRHILTKIDFWSLLLFLACALLLCLCACTWLCGLSFFLLLMYGLGNTRSDDHQLLFLLFRPLFVHLWGSKSVATLRFSDLAGCSDFCWLGLIEVWVILCCYDCCLIAMTANQIWRFLPSLSQLLPRQRCCHPSATSNFQFRGSEIW